MNTAQEIARIEWLLSFEQPQERIEALQRELAALTA